MAKKSKKTAKIKKEKHGKKVEKPKGKTKGKDDVLPSKPKKIPPPPTCFKPEDLERLTEIYSLYDKDKSGMVPIKEFPTILRKLGFNPKPNEITKMYEKILEDDIVETFMLHEWFLMVEMKMAMPDDRETNVIEAMAILGTDEDDTGVINLEVLKQELTAWGEPFVDTEFLEWIKIAKKDKTFNPEDKTFYYKKFIENMNEKDTKFVKEPVNYYKLDQRTLAALAKEQVEKERKEQERKEAEKLAKEEAKRKRMIESGLLMPDE